MTKSVHKSKLQPLNSLGLPGCAGHIIRGPCEHFLLEEVVTGSFMSILHGVLSSDFHAGVPVSLDGPVFILLGAPVQRLLCVTACWSWPNLADVHPSVSSAAASQRHSGRQPALHGSHTHRNTCSCLMRKRFGACAMLDARGCVLSLSSFGLRRHHLCSSAQQQYAIVHGRNGDSGEFTVRTLK